MTNLSLASLKIWSRYCSIVEDHGPPRLALAAALRAAADHVYHDWSGFNCVDYLYEIADELEGADD